jgi:hypothetical protein
VIKRLLSKGYQSFLRFALISSLTLFILDKTMGSVFPSVYIHNCIVLNSILVFNTYKIVTHPQAHYFSKRDITFYQAISQVLRQGFCNDIWQIILYNKIFCSYTNLGIFFTIICHINNVLSHLCYVLDWN